MDRYDMSVNMKLNVPAEAVVIKAQWKIENFATIRDLFITEADFVSSDWIEHTPSKTKWQIGLRNGDYKPSDELRLFVTPTPYVPGKDLKSQSATFKAYLRNRHGEDEFMFGGPDKKYEHDIGVTFKKAATSTYVLPDGTLHFVVFINFIPGGVARLKSVTTEKSAIPSQLQLGSEEFRSTVMGLFNSGDFSDFKIVVQASEAEAYKERSFDIHKFVLAKSSTVLADLFTAAGRRTASAESGAILTISDVSYESVHEMLKFLYGFRLDLSGYSEQLEYELFQLAERYAIKGMQNVFAKRSEPKLPAAAERPLEPTVPEEVHEEITAEPALMVAAPIVDNEANAARNERRLHNRQRRPEDHCSMQ